MKGVSERINPVLVKDVRQALRGRLFRVLFVMTLSLAAVAAVSVLLVISRSGTDQDETGAGVFLVLHGVYAAAAFLLVPLMANRSMAAERDSLTYDALLVSGLSSAQIVLGKWLASGVLLGLFLSACAPFLALGYTLYGLDVATSLALIVLTTLMGFALCLLGVLLASLVRNRGLDTLLLGLQIVFAIGVLTSWLGYSGFALTGFLLRGMGTSEFLWGVAAALLGGVLLLAWLFGLCVAVIAHPEENASTRLRLTSLGVTLVLMAIGVYSSLTSSGFHLPEYLAFLVVVVSLLNLTLVSECNTLGRRTRLDLDAGRWRWRFAWLLLPGGGRAFALYLLQLAAVVSLLAVLALPPSVVPMRPVSGSDLRGLFATLCIAITFLGFPALLAARPGFTLAMRNRMRVLTPFLLPGAMLLGMLAGLLSDDPDMAQGRAQINPFWVGERAWSGSASAMPGLILFAITAVLCVLLNLRRMHVGRREVVERVRAARSATSTGRAAAAGSADELG